MPSKKPEAGEPKFPYTTDPPSLRRLLTEIPKRPKPPKITMETLKAWNVSKNNNARTAVTVLKKLGFLGSAGEPTEIYVEFMKTGIGPGILAQRIRDVYRVLFENSHAPQNESNEELKKLFNIHSGGGTDAMRLQVQTFKILAEYANFGILGATSGSKDHDVAGSAPGLSPGAGEHRLPPVQVDLHIHLPENKTTREYEAIIQDIAKYIYGREVEKA
jgi:hypothetical protein